MKKYVLGSLVVSMFAVSLFFAFGISAQTEQLSASDDDRVISTDRKPKSDSIVVSTTLVLSQVSGGNGTYADDWVEIKNVSTTSQSLNGLSLYYGSATGVFGAGTFALPNVSLAPGQYYLVRLPQSGGAGSPLPVTPDATAAVGAIAMSGSNGKVGLVVASQLAASTCGSTGTPCNTTQLAAFVDWVAYGSGGNGSAGNGEGGTSVNNGVALTSTQGSVRNGAGCTDTDNNNADFGVVTNSVPRNSATAAAPCAGIDPSVLSAGILASPSTVAVPGDTLLTVTVVPATIPASTGITVTGNLTAIGGVSGQPLYDDGTHGDETAGDNIFSLITTIPNTVNGGSRNVSAVAADLEGRTANVNQTIIVTVPSEAENPLLFGNPSNATANINNFENFLMVKPQYTLSYNRTNKTPNWVAWRLDSSWIGSSGRSDAFGPDTTLPAGWYQVTPTDYSEPIYDRGHMCPSGDRTNSVANNIPTFLMTNMVPQLPDNNQGPWADFENYCRTLASQGNEIYIISGPNGNNGVIGNGVVIPTSTWKIVLVMPNGSNDLQRVGKRTRMFGVIMSNIAITRSSPWRNFRVTVDQVETLTGYDFFSNLSPRLQARMESSADTQ
ncbi:MAG: DNA/RNA non-specific endonuclease [Chloracidobacterium sp.]|nr:DNA/RNA non-specific endonuclease [Chloracidobacterium sp.]